MKVHQLPISAFTVALKMMQVRWNLQTNTLFQMPISVPDWQPVDTNVSIEVNMIGFLPSVVCQM